MSDDGLVEVQAAILDAGDEVVLRRYAGRFRMVWPLPLCQHRHRTAETATECGVKEMDRLMQEAAARINGGAA